ncbi:MAG: response regulator [Deltaproteobacteria bacterium]|nr:response regulator [Deltaproteobacteria bacterium]
MTKILAIDDRQDNLIILSAILKNSIANCTIITAQSGIEGLKKAEQELPDTILLDIIMPQMDGYEVCAKLKANKATSHIPVIMITAIKTESTDITKGLDTGADAFLGKPIDESVLIAQVNTAIRIKKAEDKLRDQQGLLETLIQERTSELRQSEKKYRTLLETTSQGCWQINPERKIIEVNPALCKMLVYSRQEMLGKTALDFVDDENKKIFIEQSAKISSTKHRSYEIFLKKKTGEDLPAHFNATTIRDESGNIQGAFAFISDITELKRAEKEKEELRHQLIQAQKMEAIGTLAGGIAHDFNNILSSVLGYTELALFDVDKKTVLHDNLTEALVAGNRAKELVKQLLTLSRHDTSETRPLGINSLVKEALKMLRSTIPTSIEIKENICNEQLVIQADPTRINQVIVNLAVNAKHAMSDTGGVLAVDVRPVTVDKNTANKYTDAAPGDYARITVSDTGTGIEEKNLYKIFDPYFTTKEKGKGTGLGLSVVHGIIKHHKGYITVKSEPGKGTTFNVFLPLTRQHSEKLPPESAGPLPKGTERILVVDDELMITDLLQQILERLGYTVTALVSSIDALEAFRSSPDAFDLVITDMTMPKMSGDMLAGEIKKIRPDIPVILCTGFSDKINGRPGPEFQINEFLMKPANTAKLAKTIRNVLDGKSC